MTDTEGPMTETPSDAARELWVLCYLHDWDPPREDGTQPVYPEVSQIFQTETEAHAAQQSKSNPEKYGNYILDSRNFVG